MLLKGTVITREKGCERITVGFGFTSGFDAKLALVFLSQSRSVVSAKPITLRHSNDNHSKIM